MKNNITKKVACLAVALCMVAPQAQATDFTLNANVTAAFDLGFNPIALPDISGFPGFAAVYQVDFSILTENVSAGELGFASVAYSVGLNNLTDAAGGWQPTAETVDTNGPAPGGTASLFATNLDAGTPGDLVGILTAIAGGLTTSSATDDRILIGQAPNGERVSGSIFVQWDGTTLADLSTTDVAFVANSDTGLFLPSSPGASTMIQFGGGGGGGNAPTAIFANAPYSVGTPTTPGNAVLPVTLDATPSTGDGPLTFAWDLDGNGTFETPGTNGGADSTLLIADAINQFGIGFNFPVGVQVTNSLGSSTLGTTVSVIPEPASLLLASMGLIGIVAARRRRAA